MREKRPLVWPEYRSASSPSFLTLILLPALSLYHSILPQSYCFTRTLINFPHISMCLPTFNSSLCMFESQFILSEHDLVSPADWTARVHACAQDADEYPTVALWELPQTNKGNAYSERAEPTAANTRKQFTVRVFAWRTCVYNCYCMCVFVCRALSDNTKCTNTKGKPHIPSHLWRWQ